MRFTLDHVPETINIIGDIAGNFDTLLALLTQMPEGFVVSVGDMVDRGPKSRQVLEFFQSCVVNNTGAAVLGNHEKMMIDALDGGGFSDWRRWHWNGAYTTLQSFHTEDDKATALATEMLPFLQSLPISIEIGDLFISHAPWVRDVGEEYGEFEFVWNRFDPLRKPGKFCVFGHNRYVTPKYFMDEFGEYAIGIDTSGAAKNLTGFSWPSRQIFQQKIID
jgi:serine/threonine protein phosphatase 1